MQHAKPNEVRKPGGEQDAHTALAQLLEPVEGNSHRTLSRVTTDVGWK